MGSFQAVFPHYNTAGVILQKKTKNKRVDFKCSEAAFPPDGNPTLKQTGKLWSQYKIQLVREKSILN